MIRPHMQLWRDECEDEIFDGNLRKSVEIANGATKMVPVWPYYGESSSLALSDTPGDQLHRFYIKGWYGVWLSSESTFH